jgi:hypothetical protein
VTKKELAGLLKTLLAALIEQETPPPTPKSPPETRRPPAEGHEPHLRWDRDGFQVMCCPAHDDEAWGRYLSLERTHAAFERLGSPQWQYIRERLGPGPRRAP